MILMKRLYFLLLPVLAACGDLSSKQASQIRTAPTPFPVATTAPQTSFYVDSKAKLPACDTTRTGTIAYVKDEKKLYGCDGAWSELELAKGEKGDTGAAGEAGAAGTAGLTIVENKNILGVASDLCTTFGTQQVCYFNSGQFIKYSDGTVHITGSFYFSSAFSGDTDIDHNFVSFIVPPGKYACEVLGLASRDGVMNRVWLSYEPDRLAIRFDNDGDIACEPTDALLATLTLSDW